MVTVVVRHRHYTIKFTVNGHLHNMSQRLPIPEPLWATVPADAQAAFLGARASLQDRIAALEATVRDLQARFQLNL